jgi:hypothetical protein
MIHECARCHYKSEKKSSYIDHLNKKNKCPTIYSNKSIEELIRELKVYDKPHSCDQCDKSYSHSSGLSRHIKESHVTINNITDNSNHITTDNSNHITTTDNSNHHNTTNTTNNNITNNTTNNITNNITVQIVPFGEENTTYLFEQKSDLLLKCLKNVNTNGVVEMFVEIYMNDEYPQHKNIKHKSSKHPPTVYIFAKNIGKDEPEWIVRPTNYCIEIAIKNIIDILKIHKNYLFEQIPNPTSEDLELYDEREEKLNHIKNKSLKKFAPIRDHISIVLKDNRI